MKKNIDTSPDALISKKLFRTVLFFIYPAYILHSLVVSPAFTMLYYDMGVDKLFPIALYFLSVFIDIFAFLLSFAVIVYGVLNIPLKRMRSILLIIILAPLFKYALKMFISPWIDGIPDIDTILMDLYSLLISYILEIIQFALVLVASLLIAKKHRMRCLMEQKRSAYSEKSFDSDLNLMPFKKIISFKNPLQLGAMLSALVIVVGRVYSLLVRDLSLTWRLTSINQYLTLFAPYFIELIIGVIGYFFMLYVYITLFTTKNKE